MEVELVAPDAGESDIEDEVRVGPSGQERDERRLAIDRRGVYLVLDEPRLADLVLRDRHRASTVAVVEFHEQDLARAGLMERHGFG